MSRMLVNLDELEQLSQTQQQTLEHAAAISALVTERTIGPRADCPIVEKKPRLKSPAKLKSPKPPARTPPQNARNGPATKTPSPRIEAMSSLQNLDLNTLKASILLREAEQQRVRTARQQMMDMASRNKSAAATAHKSPSTPTTTMTPTPTTSSSKWLEQRRIDSAVMLQEAEQQAAVQSQEHERQIDALRKQTQRKLQVVAFEAVAKYQNQFRTKYEIIARLLVSIDKQALLACGEYNSKLKELIKMFDELLGKVKTGDCGPSEMNMAQNLCHSLDALERCIVVDLEGIVKREQQKAADAYKEEEQEAARKQQEAERKQRELTEATTMAAAAAAATPATTITMVQPITVPTQAVPAYNPQAAAAVQQQPAAAVAPQAQAQPQTHPQSPAAMPATRTPNAAGNPYVSAERLQFYTQINHFYHEKVERVKTLQADEAMKKYRFACQKIINIPVNAISAVSRQHLQDKFEKLYNFLSGQPVNTADGPISVNDHPVGRDYCLLLTAKKFVSQGDTAISSNPQAAFPVAAVIVSLWKLVPDFGNIFLAYTFKESPFLVPYFIPQKAGQSVEDYYKVLGYRVDASGTVEQQDMYLKRQAGIVRLYGAVMTTCGRQVDGPQHPYGIEHGWRWLTNFVALAPLPEICATLLLEMLQVIGSSMWASYGKQFTKLLLHIQLTYFPQLSADEGGPKARLELLLAKCLREIQIQQPPGTLPPNFW